MKNFIVSDIHSFKDELVAALKRAGYQKSNSNHRLIICGDLFDRGSQTVELYNYLKPIRNLVLVKGNHEYLYEELLKKKFPDSYDFSNHTVDTFCHIAGYSPEVMTGDYWYKLGEESPYDRIQQTWKEILKAVQESEITKWIKSKKWKNYYELDKYIFVHSFIPLKNVDGLPSYYIHNRRFEYFKDWRTAATNLEWYDATWGCPYQQYLDGYFKDEEAKGKVLVCGHWVVTDFRQHMLNMWSDDTSIFYSEHLIGLDCGVWHYRGTSGYVHPQNVLVIDDDDYNKCYDDYGTELEEEKAIPRIETVTPGYDSEF